MDVELCNFMGIETEAILNSYSTIRLQEHE